MEQSADTLPHPNSVNAREVFTTFEETRQLAEQSIVDGTIQVSLVGGEDGPRSDLSPVVLITENDLIPEARTGNSKNGKFEEFNFADPDAMLDRVKDLAHMQLVERIVLENEWHLEDPGLKELIEQGKVSQHFELRLDEKNAVDVVNFSNSLLTEEQLEHAKAIVQKTAELTGSNIFRVLKAICILPETHISPETAGWARVGSGVVGLNEAILTGKLNFGKFKELDITQFQKTLTHEVAHMVDGGDFRGSFLRMTGWEKHRASFVDDFGDVYDEYRQRLKTVPYVVTIADKDGELEDIVMNSYFGKEEVQKAAPVTSYAYTNEREDFAEAYVPYMHGSEEQKILDAVRKDAIDRTLRYQRDTDELVTTSITADQIPLTVKIGSHIKPDKKIVGEPLFVLDIPSNRPIDYSNLENAYVKASNDVVDDYGTQVHVYNTRIPRS